jgi:predicted kinase
MPTNTLLCLCGLPRSGKTTYARSLHLPIVCPDAIRLSFHGQRFFPPAEPWVWAFASTMVSSLFLAGHTQVVLDATNTTRMRRQQWRSNELWTVSYGVLLTSKDTCRTRAEAVNDQEIITVIERMAAQWEPLGDDEGHHFIIPS